MGFKSGEKESFDCFLFQSMFNYARDHEVALLPGEKKMFR